VQAAATAWIRKVGRPVWLTIALATTAPVYALRSPEGGGARPAGGPPAALQSPTPDAQKETGAPETPQAPGVPADPGVHSGADPGARVAPETPAQNHVPNIDTAARPPQKPAASGSSGDSFTPSERIDADSAVSFPADI
jgi:hypothetical protein